MLLRVLAAWPLPGLGLLVLPDGPTPHLDAYALHTALMVEMVWPDGPRQAAIATVEEITRAETGAAAARGLLFDDSVAELSPGASVWLVEEDGE
jgi:hypothetical protein